MRRPDAGNSDWQQVYAERLTIVVVTRDGRGSRRVARHRQPADALLQEHAEVAQAYGVDLVPAAVLVSPDGTIASLPSTGSEAIRSMIDRTVDGSLLALGIVGHHHGPGLHLPTGPTIGRSIPPVRLAEPGGDLVDLRDVLDGDTLLIFWNPDCSLCESLRGEIEAWEARRTWSSPAAVIVSVTGGNADRGLGLRSPVLVDEGARSASSLGVFGTPAALLIGPDGVASSRLLVGAGAVVELLRTP